MAIFDELKSVAGVLQEAGKIPQYQQILEVQEKLLEMQKHIFDLEVENRDLNEKLNIKHNLLHERNAYWLLNESKEKDGPFCRLCYDKEKMLIRLDQGNYTFGWAHCNSCKTCAK